jgi:tetratricopeptide (TPR) repeat protein
MRVVLTSRIVQRAVFCLLLALLGLGLVMASTYALAEYHLRRAHKALQYPRYAQALAELRRALFYRPGSARLHLLAARTARQAGQIQDALDHLEKCRELQKGASEEQQLEEYLVRVQTGEVDQVLPFLQPYLAQEGPYAPLVLEALTRAFMADHRTDLAWGCLGRWLLLQPNNAEALFWRGMWFTQRDNLADAQKNFAMSLEVDPERVPARLALAEMLKARRKAKEAAEQYETVLRLAPGEAAARIGLAQCYLDLGRPADARAQLEAVPPEKQDGADALWLRGALAMQEGRLEQAEPLLRKAFVQQPYHPEAGYHLLLCLQRLRKVDQVHKQKARIRQVENDQKRMLIITLQELKATPSNPALQCELGEIYLRLKMTQRGVHWLHSALKIDPTNRRAHERLRDYYEALGPEGKDQAAYHRQQLARLR